MEEKTIRQREKGRRRYLRRRRLAALLKLLLALAALAAVACVVLPVYRDLNPPQEEAQAEKTLYTVETGDIKKTVFGTGAIQPSSQPGVYAKTEGTLAKLYAEMGDAVKAGDLIALLENESLATQAQDLEYALWSAQETVKKTESYDQYRYEIMLDEKGRRMRVPETGKWMMEQYSNELSIRSPANGRVMAVYIKEGDDALAVYREKGAVIMLSTDGCMKVELSGLETGTLALNETVEVRGAGIRTTGKVISLTRRGTEAVVRVESDEYAMDTPVSIHAQDGSKVAEGTLTINKPLAVSAYGGIIKGVKVEVGDKVEREKVLALFERASIPLYIDNASVLLDYAKAQVELENARKSLEALAIVAPCDGVVATVDASVGDTIASGAQVMSIFESEAGLTLTLSIDELDIIHVAPGQSAEISLNALPDVTISGTVQKIAPLGNTESSVTTYDVYIALCDVDERVMGGMNVTGEIEIDAAQDALLVPMDALVKVDGAYTVAMADGTSRGVEIGIMTRDWAQVISGLSRGEQIAY